MVLPQTRSVSKYSKSGSSDHANFERLVNGSDSVVLDSGHVLHRDSLALPNKSEAEIAFSYDVVSDEAKRIGNVGGRNYPEAAYSTVFGTADVVAINDTDQGRSADVVDFKTGSVPHMPDSWQMRFLAFSAFRTSGATYARTRITTIRDGNVTHSVIRSWSGEEMNETAKLLRKLYDQVQRMAWREEVGIQDVTTGPECHFCDGFLSCPAQKALLSNLPSPSELVNLDGAASYSLWNRLRSLEQRVGDSVKAMANGSPIRLDKRYMYGKRGDRFIKYVEEE